MNSGSCRRFRIATALFAFAALAVVRPIAARAQTPDDVNRGAIRFTGGLDAPSVFVYRGIVQEGDPKLTLTPFGELGIRLTSTEGSSGDMRVGIGLWNSLNTGTSGTGGPLKRLHYAEHFYTTLTMWLPGRLVVAPSFRAITSPNGSYKSVREINVNIAVGGRIAPYVFVASELSKEGQLDEGGKQGTYLELGAIPHVGLPFGRSTLTVPVKAGFSVSNYYELFKSDLKYHDNKFGFFDIGGLVTVPLSIAPRFGQWNIRGGADFVRFGETTKAFNAGDNKKIVGSVGVGVAY